MDVLKEQKTDFQEIFYEKGNWTARITINRPSAYNAYSTNCLEEMAIAFRQASFDDEVAVIVFTGVGGHAICGMGDICGCFSYGTGGNCILWNKTGGCPYIRDMSLAFCLQVKAFYNRRCYRLLCFIFTSAYS